MHVYRVTVPGGSDTCTCGWQGKLSCMVPTHEAARSRGGWPGPGVRVCTRLHRGLHNQVTFWSPNQGFGAALTSASRNPKLWNPCFVKAHFVHEQLRPGVAGVGCLPMSWRQEWKLVLEGCPRPFLLRTHHLHCSKGHLHTLGQAPLPPAELTTCLLQALAPGGQDSNPSPPRSSRVTSDN